MDKTVYKYLISYGELVGKIHVAKNIPCQDKVICLQRNQVSVAVLSDGCSSSEFSHFGAEITVTSISEKQSLIQLSRQKSNLSMKIKSYLMTTRIETLKNTMNM